MTEEQKPEEQPEASAEVVKKDDVEDFDLEYFQREAGEVVRHAKKKILKPVANAVRNFFAELKEDK